MNPRHVDCTNAEYHARPEHSRGQLSDLFDSAPDYHGKHIAKTIPHEHKSAWDLGDVVHAYVLEPATVDAVVIEIPIDTFRTKSGGVPKVPLNTSDCDKWKSDHPGLIHFTPAQFAEVRQMVANVKAHPVAAHLLKHATFFEHTVIWTDPETGLDLRARPDMICEFEEGFVVPELKTAKSIKPHAFAKAALEYGYHRQQHHYSEGVEALYGPVLQFPFVVVETSAPYQCEVFSLEPREVELGWAQNHAVRRDLVRRLAEDDWHSPTWGKVLPISYPNYAFTEGA